MARKVRDKALDTRAERGKLKARGNPYWRALDPGAHLGYRRIAGKAGTLDPADLREGPAREPLRCGSDRHCRRHERRQWR